jgi:2-polyprenyl-3-methyl-5-hydroxy-6-metoxy-1,4-benzoquinol methylase
MLKICSDVLIQLREGHWICSNPRTRTHVLIEFSGGEFFNVGKSPLSEEQWSGIFKNLSGRDLTFEDFGDFGLHHDHTGLKIPGDISCGDWLSGDELLKLFMSRFMLIDENEEEYFEYFKPHESILDRSHMGTFHQKVGQFLTLKKRLGKDRWKWWHDQKYSEDGLSLKESPYSFIQESFFDHYFNEGNLGGLKVLDFGCGNGYYSRKLSELGANVWGLDTSKDLIEMARKNHGNVAEFHYSETAEDGLRWLKEKSDSFDFIMMQDVLLLLINPEDGQDMGVDELLRSLKGALKKGGRLSAMEPNSTFWLASRFGDSRKPYAVVTEYQEQMFHVSPPLTKIMDVMGAAGFALSELHHPKDARTQSLPNPGQAYHNDFCIWDFMVFIPKD